MRLLSFGFILSLCTAVLGMEFVNPPPFAATTDFSLNTIYVEGSILDIEWTAGPAGNNTSLTLWQLNGTQYLQPFEYLTQNVSGSITSLAWTVQTTKDLAISNMFYLCMFLVGASASEANSHYFNITSKNAVNQNPSSSAGSSTKATSLTQLGSSNTVVSTPGSISTPNTSLSPGSASTSYSASAAGPTSALSTTASAFGGLGAGAKAGLGVGIPAAVFLGIGISWIFFCWRKKKDQFAGKDSISKGDVQEQQQEKWQRHQLMGDEHMMEPPVFELQDSVAHGEQETMK
ncbi:hypothetical protein BDZ45DRAFT_697860 [Acephala macrosclerotiorum]|nr:hypothetical protein BDZ45DRAFT_697860 [Acephala macrosclerotiorum]